jgi:hypothetical protein
MDNMDDMDKVDAAGLLAVPSMTSTLSMASTAGTAQGLVSAEEFANSPPAGAQTVQTPFSAAAVVLGGVPMGFPASSRR